MVIVQKILVAGDSGKWTYPLIGYDKLTQEYGEIEVHGFIKTMDNKLNEVTAEIEDGKKVIVTATPAQTSEYVPGKAAIIVQLTAGEDFRESKMVDRIDISPAFDDESQTFLTYAQQCVEDLKKAIQDFIAGGGRVKAYTIGTRSITYNSLADLENALKYWEAQAYLDESRRQGVDARKNLVRWGIR